MQRESLTPAWLSVLTTLVLVTGALWCAGMRVHFGAKGFVFFWCAAVWLLLSFQFHLRQEWMKRILLFGHGLLLSSAISLCGGLASYWITSVTTFPFADSLLYRADLAIGLDWRAIYEHYHGMDWLLPIMQRAYLAIFYTPLLVLLGLSATGQDERLKLFLVAMATSLTITLLIHPFFPAKTALLYLIGGNPPYVPVTGLRCADIINDLRAGNIHEIKIHEMFGLVTFPSFHAASAVILSWACWTVRACRWPVAIVNAAMVIATPLEGGHYFVDVIGGIWVGVASIHAARAFASMDTTPWMLGQKLLAQVSGNR